MTNHMGKNDCASQNEKGVKRRGLLRIGTLVTAFTGASAISAIGASTAHGAPGDKNPPNTYVPIAEKGAASGVAALDVDAKVPAAQLPDLSAIYVSSSGDSTLNGKKTFTAGLDLTGPTSQIRINGHGFTQVYDTDIWVAGRQRLNPTRESQALYLQHRLKGNVGAKVHDAGASELRLEGISNATFLNAFEASIAIAGTGGASVIPDVRSITANLHWQGAPTGTIKVLSLIRSQYVSAAPAGFTIDKVYGLYVEAQSVGTVENWSVYAPMGKSRFGDVTADTVTIGDGASNRTLRISGGAGSLSILAFQSGTLDRWLLRRDSTAESGGNAGSDLVLVARADDGTNLGNVMKFTRSNRAIQFDTGPLGFFGATPTAKAAVTGSRADGTALANLLTELASKGLITNSTTA